MTFNIRYNNAADSQDAWVYRKDKVAAQVQFHDIALLGVQEALYDQVLDMQERLPGFSYFGCGRDDGKTKGEYAAVFYDTTRLKWLAGATFWLSQTPEVAGSKGWDAAITRIVTWCKFRDKRSGRVFFAFNTHFDHMGKEARAESAKLLLQKVKLIAGSLPAVVTGDFNAIPTDEPIQIITNTKDPDHLTDSKQLSKMLHYGPGGTFNGFKQKERDDFPIDYIFIRNNVQVLRHATLSQSWQGHFSSDHFPVMAVLVL